MLPECCIVLLQLNKHAQPEFYRHYKCFCDCLVFLYGKTHRSRPKYFIGVDVSLNHSSIVILMQKGITMSALCACSESLRCVEITTSVDDASRPCQTSLVTTAMCLAYWKVKNCRLQWLPQRYDEIFCHYNDNTSMCSSYSLLYLRLYIQKQDCILLIFQCWSS